MFRADLEWANLFRADLEGANLEAADLREANLSESIIKNNRRVTFDLYNMNEINKLKPIVAELGQNDTAIGEQIATLSENDESIMAEINEMKAQLQTLTAQVAEKDQRIAELEQGGGGQSLEQILEQVRDARAGSIVLTVDPDGNNITLGLTIEQSDNLTEWTKLDGEMTRTIPIPDGKKFYRFALDK